MGALWFFAVLELRLNPALTERAATGWRAESLSQDATAGRGPSRLRKQHSGGFVTTGKSDQERERAGGERSGFWLCWSFV